LSNIGTRLFKICADPGSLGCFTGEVAAVKAA